MNGWMSNVFLARAMVPILWSWVNGYCRAFTDYNLKEITIVNKYKTFSVLIYSYINTSRVEIGKTKNCVETRFHTISSFPNSTSVDITVYQYGKKVLYFL